MAPAFTPRLVLIVDDDDDVAETVGFLLEDSGYAVARACNGAEACQALEDGMRPALILLDLMMPVMTGPEFLLWQRTSEYADVPVVVFTASISIHGLTYGVDEVPLLLKTAGADQILSVVAHATA